MLSKNHAICYIVYWLIDKKETWKADLSQVDKKAEMEMIGASVEPAARAIPLERTVQYFDCIIEERRGKLRQKKSFSQML